MNRDGAPGEAELSVEVVFFIHPPISLKYGRLTIQLRESMASPIVICLCSALWDLKSFCVHAERGSETSRNS